MPGGEICEVKKVRFSPDGKVLASAYVENYTHLLARVWEVDTGREIRRFPGSHDQKKFLASTIRFSPNGRYIIVGGTYFLTIFELPELQNFHQSAIETTDGRSMAGITLGQSTASDIRARFGVPDSVQKNDFWYSYQMIYSKIGLSFWFLQPYVDPAVPPGNSGEKGTDLRESIFRISIIPPYRLRTTTGIILNKSTMQDVRNAYGELNWEASDGSDYWFSDHDGIEYGVLRDKTVPQFPLDEQLHMLRTIVIINLDNRYR